MTNCVHRNIGQKRASICIRVFRSTYVLWSNWWWVEGKGTGTMFIGILLETSSFTRRITAAIHFSHNRNIKGITWIRRFLTIRCGILFRPKYWLLAICVIYLIISSFVHSPRYVLWFVCVGKIGHSHNHIWNVSDIVIRKMVESFVVMNKMTLLEWLFIFTRYSTEWHDLVWGAHQIFMAPASSAPFR